MSDFIELQLKGNIVETSKKKKTIFLTLKKQYIHVRYGSSNRVFTIIYYTTLYLLLDHNVIFTEKLFKCICRSCHFINPNVLLGEN